MIQKYRKLPNRPEISCVGWAYMYLALLKFFFDKIRKPQKYRPKTATLKAEEKEKREYDFSTYTFSVIDCLDYKYNIVRMFYSFIFISTKNLL